MSSQRKEHAGRQPLLDVQAAAAYLGVTPRFMRRLVAERRIAFVKLGRHVRFDVSDLESFVDSGRVEAVRRGRFSSPVGRIGSA